MCYVYSKRLILPEQTFRSINIQYANASLRLCLSHMQQSLHRLCASDMDTQNSVICVFLRYALVTPDHWFFLTTFHVIFNARLGISRLLIRINMPDNIVRQSIYPVSRALRHLRKAFGFGLVLECVCGEVDARAVDVGFYDNVDATDAVEWYLFVWVAVQAVTHLRHVDAVGLVLFVA